MTVAETSVTWMPREISLSRFESLRGSQSFPGNNSHSILRVSTIFQNSTQNKDREDDDV